jgi:phage tail-like protein
MVDYYPPWGFYYKVEFTGLKGKNDVRFQTVSGLSVEYDMEEFKEGGENRFTHKLPGRTKYAPNGVWPHFATAIFDQQILVLS